ncbi:hypothetical protein K491DRAFT_291807 [Lophiostoma macrostomum CBS 122681]|uniref:Uncharacterized protein n=1 Tax=Lophiostoma macrostomum CBS 122681 TaxID=1314788 RepID=A0A6A6SL67_9PLEO|nr:hypothetical protein K491DRAFT_291807 [Lophiostoma macrostomum CBS 122681]
MGLELTFSHLLWFHVVDSRVLLHESFPAYKALLNLLYSSSSSFVHHSTSFNIALTDTAADILASHKHIDKPSPKRPLSYFDQLIFRHLQKSIHGSRTWQPTVLRDIA